MQPVGNSHILCSFIWLRRKSHFLVPRIQQGISQITTVQVSRPITTFHQSRHSPPSREMHGMSPQRCTPSRCRATTPRAGSGQGQLLCPPRAGRQQVAEKALLATGTGKRHCRQAGGTLCLSGVIHWELCLEGMWGRWGQNNSTVRSEVA